jgi:2-amino-4-hydroxy-6-hydroxymethyldihydropteridine diphosphokinase
MENVYLGLGANLGNREENISKAIELLKQNEFIWVKQIAKIIETEGFDVVKQPKYLNTVVLCETILTPEELLALTQQIECQMGRTGKGKKQARPIDIDILFYGQDIICQDNLIIPHPLLHERSFVLIPLNELAPNLQHPILQESIFELYKRVVGY